MREQNFQTVAERILRIEPILNKEQERAVTDLAADAVYEFRKRSGAAEDEKRRDAYDEPVSARTQSGKSALRYLNVISRRNRLSAKEKFKILDGIVSEMGKNIIPELDAAALSEADKIIMMRLVRTIAAEIIVNDSFAELKEAVGANDNKKAGARSTVSLLPELPKDSERPAA